MKNITIIASLFLTILSCKAQTIPLEDFHDYPDDIPDGAYVKDVNNLLDKYIGNWIGTHNNHAYEFRIIKIAKSFLGITFDELELRYKITDSYNVVIEDTTNVPAGSYLIVNGMYPSNTSNFYLLNYVGEGGDCGQAGTLYIAIPQNNLNTMVASLNPAHDMISMADCPNGVVPQILPTEQFTLVKQ